MEVISFPENSAAKMPVIYFEMLQYIHRVTLCVCVCDLGEATTGCVTNARSRLPSRFWQQGSCSRGGFHSPPAFLLSQLQVLTTGYCFYQRKLRVMLY